MGYVLGVDGGGTRTICLLADLEGNVLGQGETGPSNFQSVGLEKAVQAIRQSIVLATKEAPAFTTAEAICLGLAGVDTAQDAALIQGQVESLNLARRVCVLNDAEIALIGGVGGGRGVAIVAGTGSVAFGCDQHGRKARAGGWGWILGDEGSAFDISRQGLRAVARALEGRGKATSLVEALAQRWGWSSQEELVAALRGCTWSRGEVAALADWVTEAAQDGDAIAREITTQAGKELGLMAVSVIRQLQMEGEFGVVLTGGIFQAGEIVTRPLEQTIRAESPKARVMTPVHPPVLGAVFMAWHMAGLIPNKEIMDRANRMTRARE